MGEKYTLQNKVVWQGKITGSLADSLYPSFYKSIMKKEAFFSENFKSLLEDANPENITAKFIPLYKSEIMNRKSFTLNRNEIIDSILQRITKNPLKYKLLSISSVSDDKKIFGAAVFSVANKKLSMAFRAYKRDLGAETLKHKASLDYWGEKIIREYGTNLGLEIFSYGRDSHPYIGKERVGWALYKLKAGTKPKLPRLDNPEKPVKTIEINKSFLLSKNKPVIFFDSPSDNGFYQNCSFYYPYGSVHESFVNEFKVVCEWAGILFNPVSH